MSKSIPKELLTKFRHPSWWKGQGLTKQQALDEMAKSGDFYLDKKINIKKTEIANIGKPIFDRVEIYDDVIKYAGKEKGLYRISPIEKEYFIKQKEYYKKQRKKESEKKAKDPKEIAKQIKIELANLEYNLEHSKSELDIALQKYPEDVDFWAEKVKEDEKKLLEFKKRHHLESEKRHLEPELTPERVYGWNHGEVIKKENKFIIRHEDTGQIVKTVLSKDAASSFFDGYGRGWIEKGKRVLSTKKAKYLLVQDKEGNILLRTDKARPEIAQAFIDGYKIGGKRKIDFWHRAKPKIKPSQLAIDKIKDDIYDLVASGDVDDSIIEAMETINDRDKLIELIEKHII